MLMLDTQPTKRDMIVSFKNEDMARSVLKNLTRMNMSLVMATQPIRDRSRVAFFCVSTEELDSLRDLIRETGGAIENIETY